MEDNSQGVAATGPQAAYAVPEIDSVSAARALDRAMANGKSDCISLAKRYHLWSSLHTRALLC